MKFKYMPDKEKIIIEHENKMLAEYQKIFNTYATAFSEHGCTIKSGCGWSNLLKRNYSEERLPFRNGYACYIYCDIQRNGKSILYEDKEGEADCVIILDT